MWQYNQRDELYHHGVMGMKWGVHRYKNKSGNITAKGEKRFSKVANSKYKTARDKKTAKSVVKWYENTYDQASKQAGEMSVSAYKKGNKMRTKAESYYDSKTGKVTNQKKYDKYQNKAEKQFAKSSKRSNQERETRLMSEQFKKKYDDIEQEKIKAGKDYIVQRDNNLFLVPSPVGLVIVNRRTNKIVTRKKDKVLDKATF